MSILLGDMLVRYKADISDLTVKTAAAAAEIKGVGSAASLGGLAIAGAFVATGVAVGAFSVIATKMAGDFQQNITKLYTTAGELHSNLQMVGDGILSMSASVGTGAIKLSEAMYWIESGGLHGARGLSALRIAAEAAKAENANLDAVSIALVASLNAYANSGMTDVQVMNTLTAATGQGMMTFEQLSSSLASVLPAAAKFHISLNNVTAAMATMTAQGDPAAQAATHLKQMILALEAPSKIGAAALKSVGLSSVEVANQMKTNLPAALQMIIDAVGKKFPEGSAAYNQAIKNIAGGSKQMMGFLELTGSHMATFTDNVHKISAAVKQGGNDLMGWSDIQKNFNFQMDSGKAAVEALLIAVGMQLLPVLTRIVATIAPVISAFAAWVVQTHAIQNALSFLGNIVGGIGAAFNSVFNPVKAVLTSVFPPIQAITDAFDRTKNAIKTTFPVVKDLSDAFDRSKGVLKGFSDAFKPLTDQFDRTTKVVAPYRDALDRTSDALKKTTGSTTAAVSPLQFFFQGVKNVAAALAMINWAAVWAALQHIGAAIMTVSAIISKVDWGNVFRIVWAVLQQIGAFIMSTFLPVWQQLVTSFHDIQAALLPIMPQLTMLGQIIGGTIVVAVVLFIAILAGLISALAGVLVGVAQFVTGVIQFFSGLVQFISGIMNVIADLITGNWKKIGTDLDATMHGLFMMFQGVWNMISGLISAVFGTIVGFAHGFASAIIGIFQAFSNAIVGHSIIPDMINAIVRVFSTLAGLVTGPVNNAVNTIMGILRGAIGLATNAGSAIIQGLAAGIQGAIGFVAGAIGNVVNFIASHLPHSPAKVGPLRDLEYFGSQITKQLSQGMLNAKPSLQTSLNMMLAYPIRPSASSVAVAAAASGGSSNGGQTLIFEVNGHQLAQIVNTSTDRTVRLKLGSQGRAA